MSKINEAYKIHYPSLKKLIGLSYSDPRIDPEGKKIYVEREGVFRLKGETIQGHYVIYEDNGFPGSYIAVHISSELSEDTGEPKTINVIAIDPSRSSVLSKVSYRMRKGSLSTVVEGKTKISKEEKPDIKSHLSRHKGKKMSVKGFKFGQTVTYTGKEYYIYDYDAVRSSPNGVELILVDKSFSELISGVITTVVENKIVEEGKVTFGRIKMGDTFYLPGDPDNAALIKVSKTHYAVVGKPKPTYKLSSETEAQSNPD